MGGIHIGTSGWSYSSWKNVFYPNGLKGGDYLSFYSGVFESTEINGSFYRLPTKKTVENWVNAVPDDFRFCVKMSRFLTQIKRLKEPEEPIERFFDVFAAMQRKMGPVLIQLPPSLKFDYDLAEYFYQLLKDKYSSNSFALEGRHETWLSEDSLNLMAKYDVAFVISNSGGFFPYKEAVTAKNIYIRFHGPEEKFKSRYDDETLNYYADLIKVWLKENHDVWAFFNNTYYQDAIENASKLKSLL